MKSFSSIKPRRVVLVTLCTVGIVSCLSVTRARADAWDKKTVLTINEPIQVRDTMLQPGQYVFKLVDSSSDRHIVQIFNGDQTHLIDTILAIPNYRLNPEGRQFAFYETPAGSAKALRAWFYPGDNFGQEFPYPKHLAMMEPAAALAPAPQPEPSPEPQPAPASPETAPEPEAAAPAPEAAPAPAPTATESAPVPEPAQAPQPAQQSGPATLPKTASPYPLIGLSGLLSMCVYGLLRVRRSA